MKKFLPTSINLSVNKKGFTLIELLVVISIIAVLAVIGFISYQGVTGRARDGRRIMEIDAITLAMEKGFVTSTNKYIVLKDADFANNVIPTDPYSGSSKCGVDKTLFCEYCGAGVTTGALPTVAINSTTTCMPAATTGKVTTALPVTDVIAYRVCATLENPVGNQTSKYLYCKANAQ